MRGQARPPGTERSPGAAGATRGGEAGGAAPPGRFPALEVLIHQLWYRYIGILLLLLRLLYYFFFFLRKVPTSPHYFSLPRRLLCPPWSNTEIDTGMGHPPWLQEMWVQILARLPSQLELELRCPSPTRAPAVPSHAGAPASSFLSERFPIVQAVANPLPWEKVDSVICPVRDPSSPSCSRDCRACAPYTNSNGKNPMGKPWCSGFWAVGTHVLGSAQGQ